MPIYEYLCDTCRRRFSALVGVVAGASEVSCPRCGGRELTKLVSRFSSFRSEDDLDDLADAGNLEDDPRALRRWARGMGGELGEHVGDGFEDEVDAALEEDREAADEDAGEEG